MKTEKTLVEGRIAHRDSGFAMTVTLAIVTALMVVATAFYVAIWQTSAQAAEPEGGASAASESSQVIADIEKEVADMSAEASRSAASADAGDEADGALDDAAADQGEDAADDSAGSGAEAEGEGAGGDSASSAAASSRQTASADASRSAASASRDAASERALERSIKTDDGRRYTVRVAFGSDAEIPQGAELSVVRVMQTPEGYDPEAREWKGRPTDEERFVSASKMAERVAELAKVFDVREGDYVFYNEFLDISFVADGREVQPAAPVTVTIETDAVRAEESGAVWMSFYGQVRKGQELADVIEADNYSADPYKGDAKDKKREDTKAYKKGAKWTFEASKLTELGIEGYAIPLRAEQVQGMDVTVLGAVGSEAWTTEAWVDENALPEGAELVGAFGFGVDPDPDYGTQLWVEAVPVEGAGAEAEAEGAEAAEAAEGEAADSVAADDANTESGLAGYLLEGGALSKQLFGPEGTSEPVAVSAKDAMALVLLSGAPASDEGEGDDAAAADGDAEGSVPEGSDEAADAEGDASGNADEDAEGADDEAAGADAADVPSTDATADTTTIKAAVEPQSTAAILNGAFASNGVAYTVKLSYGPEANIPEGATLKVRELTGAERSFAEKSALRALGATEADYLCPLDITIVDAQGNAIEPAAPVEVTVRLVGAPDAGNASVVHLGASGPELIDADAKAKKNASVVAFTADAFSTFVLALGVQEGEDAAILQKELTDLEGSWATWTIKVNPQNVSLNNRTPLTLKDTFTSNQSIDYASIKATEGVTYDYRGQTGTFVIPDSASATISYRTRVVAQQPGQNVTFGNKAELYKSSEEAFRSVNTDETHVIYPSASDVATTTGNYMVKFYVYGNANMQTGIGGAKFILLDENRRPMTYKLGDNAGNPVTFDTDDKGYANIQLNEEPGDVSIEKNTQYYVEMIQAPEGYKKDNSLYGFKIKDNPNYNNYEYYNGDTLKVRLYAEEASLSVSMRFSGNYSLTTEQQNDIQVILQKKDGDGWVDVEPHSYSDFNYGSLTFGMGQGENAFIPGDTYRVIQKNERPWDVPETVNLTTNYYLIVGSGSENEPATKPQEFTITEENKGSSFNVVIDNEYEEHELTITKMDKETGVKLSGAVFTAKKASDDSKVATYTTDNNGVITISGGSDYESEILYYIVETEAPTGYLLPVNPEKIYFYFCNDPAWEERILSELPDGKTAVNLTKTYDSLTLDNQKELRTIPVMKTWQGNEWPDSIHSVVFGLYQSVDGAKPTAVVDEQSNEPRTVTLTKQAPYNNSEFKDLPARDGDKTITYSIKEEHVYTSEARTEDILSSYVQEYGVSDAGVYVVRNSPATTLTVNKKWFNGDVEVAEEAQLAHQSAVTFDVYRSTAKIGDDIATNGITNEEMETFVATLTKVREGLTFGASDNWATQINDLPLKDDRDQSYYYYILETVPSFGTEVYEAEVDEGGQTVTIKNQVAPETVNVTVKKAELVDDPRPEAAYTDFTFTLALSKGTHPIRSYQVADGLVTDWNGEATFTLKPEGSINLSLPLDVTATIVEAENPEYVVTTDGGGMEDQETANGRVFSFDVNSESDSKTVTFTNTLRVICKVIDNNGNAKPFESLKSALTYIRDNPSSFTEENLSIYMLEDYVMPYTDVFDVKEGENVTLTTASTADDTFPFHTERTENTDTAIITRGSANGSMLTNSGTLNLGKITLDGAKEAYTVAVDGGLVNNTGTLNLTSDATLQNSKVSGKGGAIYSTGAINMPGGSIIGNEATSGSAIYLNDCALSMTGGEISGNTGADDGAVVPSSTECTISLSGKPVVFDNENDNGEWANVYLGVDSDTVINVVSPGLSADAHIGVRPMETHREIGEQFATTEYEVTANLDKFVNDMYEYRGKVKDGTSTNVVWDGLTLKLNKVLDGKGANQNDAFTITLTSSSIRKSNYVIDGNLDNTVTAAKTNTPGTIVLRGVKGGDNISISPLPAGTYTITEADSNYAPTYAGKNEETDTDLVFEDESFSLLGDSIVTITNTRKLADATLTKTLEDKLKATDETQDFEFTVKLTDTDGTAVSGYILTESSTTNQDGEAMITMSPSNRNQSVKELQLPVGATVSIKEAEDGSYRIRTSAVTHRETSQGYKEAVADADTENPSIFVFQVTEDGADVTFNNTRKMAGIELRKELVGKVSKTESFDLTVTLTRADGSHAANYVMYTDAENPENNITTDGNGQVVIPFSFAEDESSKAVDLNIPDGTKLEVEEAVVKKDVNDEEKEIYDTTYSLNGGAGTSGNKVTIGSVSDEDDSILFTNSRKMKTVTVTNTVGGYSGNTSPFTFTATVTDEIEGQGDDYDAHGFTDGQMTFELATGQSKELKVPYGAKLNVTENFVVGYETTVQHGSSAAVVTTNDKFVVTDDVTVAFNNAQLINIVLKNETSHDLENVQVYTEYGTKMYRVNEDQDGQYSVAMTNHWATVSIEAGKTAILEVNHQNSVTYAQAYTVQGSGPAAGYYYTINNEPSFHEFADPAVLRIYDTNSFVVKGKLRYSVSDSTITFTEQPLVSFDANGGVWTTEMEGYRDKNGDRQVYQLAVNAGETVAKPDPDPIYPAEGINFLGWTEDEDYAKADHSDGNVDSSKLYDFESAVTAPVNLYAIWKKGDSSTRTVTVQNAITASLTIDVTLEDGNGNPSNNVTLADGITTGADGTVSFSLNAGASKELKVSDGSKLVVKASGASCIEYSSIYTDGDSDTQSFTIDSVNRDGTVAFIAGVCKITDDSGNVLYDGEGKPAVYSTLEAAFTAYNGTLYTSAAHTDVATPAAVKMLVDEYAINKKHAFPTKDVIVTTAGKDDADFPYVGVRDRATIYRSTEGAGANCFTLATGNITLTNIVLDGGSEQGVKIAKAKNGGLINMSNASGVLNIKTGTTLRNCEFAAYDDGNNSRGGAIYMTNGTLNVSAGLFSNLHGYHGGAIAVTGGTLNLTGTNSSTRFENCDAAFSGGAVYYKASGNLTIDGGNDNGYQVDAEGKTQFDADNKKIEASNPGIVFNSCAAKDSGSGDGGAIYIDSDGVAVIRGCDFVECSAKVDKWDNREHGGGAIAAININTMTVSNCTFSDCDTLTDGGAVFARVKNATSMTVNNCIFRNGSCKGQGGAVSVYQMNEGNRSNSALNINGCSFENCSSGTSNGSGGAIQSYLPVMSLIDSDFIDCWAGKEGGAINHFYDGNYTTIWSEATLTVSNCEFTRCRAEDRYDPEKPQHYAGGINSKAYTTTITDSRFTDCVSTLREGGALHLGGKGDGSSATISGSTFRNCTAKTSGGAVMASTAALTVSDSYFYGCQAFGQPESYYKYDNANKKNQNGGGAISHSENSRGSSIQNTTKITNCVFSADPESGDGAQSCSTATDGGAIWTRATTVEITACTINDSAANGNGGGIYLKKNGSQSATITGGSITNCQATQGSAVYVEDKATFSGDLSVTGNTCSNVDSGAIQGGTLNFEGNVEVHDNPCSADDSCMHDVLMQNDNVTTIKTTSNGLGAQASIGVYVPDQNNRFNKYGKEGQAFGTWAKVDDALDSFFNDRDDSLFGYQLSSSDTKIYWGVYLCKITDAEGNTLKRPSGRDAVYQRLTMAFDDFTSVTGGTPVYVKMLVEDYTIHQEATITNFPAADITLTTAGENDSSHPYRGNPGTVCTISRSASDTKTNQLFKLDTANATFQLENITLDGRKNKAAGEGVIRLIEASNGNLVVNGGTTLQYANCGANSGGAIYVSNASASLRINSSEEQNVVFDHCITADNSRTGGGGAIYTVSNLLITSDGKGKTIFSDCKAARGGAIMLGSANGADVNGAEFVDCYARNEGGALYHNNANNTTAYTTITSSSFENCYTASNAQYSLGGAVTSKTATLTVDSCSFSNCYALSNGGAINHGSDQTNRVKTLIVNTMFDNCKTTGNNNSYGYGGSVYTQAKIVELTGCSIANSTSYNYGGALYCNSNDNSSNATISGTSFDNCVAGRTGGYGGAIFTKGKTLTLQNAASGTATTINACTAPGFSGAVHMDTDNSTLNVADKTVISSCYANQGGAIYLKRNVTMNISGSPEFTRNGFTTSGQSAEKGACIYLAEGSKIYLSDSPKFSKNNLPNQPRITNGGTMDYVRQDLYLAGYSSNDANSINVNGELSGDAIWVWPEQDRHKFEGNQFGMTVSSPDTVSAESLALLRNALPDGVGGTNCSNGEYLAGVRLPGIDGTGTKVYWSKMYNISFNKKDNKAVAVPGAEFTLYTDSACTAEYAAATSADGEANTDASGEILPRGTVDFPAVPMGVYYMKETDVPTSFRENNTVYLVLVGTPNLSPNDNNKPLWENGGPLDVPYAATLVARYTTNAGKYYGIYPLGENGKADVSKNLAGATVGIINIRSDYEAYFMKVDGSDAALPNSTFTIYSQELDENGEGETYENGYPVLTLWSRDGTEDTIPDPVKSADGTNNYKKLDGSTVPKGVVYFRELPIGTYYLVETSYPTRNGNNRITYYVEDDRVFKLEITGEDKDGNGEYDFTLSEWQEDGAYNPVESKDGYYIVRNTEAVCKLTDGDNKLLYKLGHDGNTRIPAVYASLEDGFVAAQSQTLVNAKSEPVANHELNPALKLKALKDFTVSGPIEYNSVRELTLTTAERTASKEDKYAFTTNRTSDTSRAEIKWANADEGPDTLITVKNDQAIFALQNINLNGQKSGRGVHVESGSLAVQAKAKLQNFATSGEGGAVLLDSGASLTVDGENGRTAEFVSNEAAEGGAIAAAPGAQVNIQNAQFKSNVANGTGDSATGNGGAISLAGVEGAESLIERPIPNAVFTGNTASNQGGAIFVGEGYNVALANASFSSNMAKDGAAIAVASGAAVALESSTTIRSNTASSFGGAVYAADYASATVAGVITGNSASDPNGGAINVGGSNARLYFTGSPTVFGNPSMQSGAQQKNVVLSEDSNEVIRTTAEGLKGGVIGVYAVDGSIYNKHGVPDKPFGTFEDDGHANPNVFINDRNLALQGVSKSDDCVYWPGAVCKLTDSDDKLLYKDVTIQYAGKTENLKAPAIYAGVQEGFNQAQLDLYSKNSGKFDKFGKSALKLKMLQDVELASGITYSGNRKVTFTTAETEASGDDSFVFVTNRTGDDTVKALVTRAFDGGSMVAIGGGELTLASIILDGDGDNENRTATANGGIVHVGAGGGLVVAEGAVLQNSKTSGNGGAVFLAENAAMTMTAGTITGNTAAEGAGIYVAEGAKLNLQGDPSFGEEGNIASGPSLTNGGVEYKQPRQDIFIAGYGKSDDGEGDGPVATSLVLLGNLTCEEGSIWVWPEHENHYVKDMQFAIIGKGVTVTDETLKAFRDARPDAVTEATSHYLFGVRGENETYVYWGIEDEGERRVILRKVSGDADGPYDSLAGAKFRIYRSSWTPYTDSEHTDKDAVYESQSPSGVFFIGTMPYGTYYLVETEFPNGTPADYPTYNENDKSTWAYYTLTVNEETYEISDGVTLGWRGTHVDGLQREGGTTPVEPTVTSYSISVSPTSYTVGGSTGQATVIAHYSNGSSQSVTSGIIWSSSNTSVAIISNSGVITPTGAGTTTISATVNGSQVASSAISVEGGNESGASSAVIENGQFVLNIGGVVYSHEIHDYDDSEMIAGGLVYTSDGVTYYSNKDFNNTWSKDIANLSTWNYNDSGISQITINFVTAEDFSSTNNTQCERVIEKGTLYYDEAKHKLWAAYHDQGWYTRPDIDSSNWNDVSGLLSN